MYSHMLGELAIHSIVFSPVVAIEHQSITTTDNLNEQQKMKVEFTKEAQKDAFLCAVCLFSIDKPSLCTNAVIAETVSEGLHGCIRTQ